MQDTMLIVFAIWWLLLEQPYRWACTSILASSWCETSELYNGDHKQQWHNNAWNWHEQHHGDLSTHSLYTNLQRLTLTAHQQRENTQNTTRKQSHWVPTDRLYTKLLRVISLFKLQIYSHKCIVSHILPFFSALLSRFSSKLLRICRCN